MSEYQHFENAVTPSTCGINAKRKTQNAKRKTQNAKRKTQNAKRKTQDAKRKRQDATHICMIAFGVIQPIKTPRYLNFIQDGDVPSPIGLWNGLMPGMALFFLIGKKGALLQNVIGSPIFVSPVVQFNELSFVKLAKGEVCDEERFCHTGRTRTIRDWDVMDLVLLVFFFKESSILEVFSGATLVFGLSESALSSLGFQSGSVKLLLPSDFECGVGSQPGSAKNSSGLVVVNVRAK
ncbi:hypothetical protein EV424DRAFT_1349296 [Suillus variegatus]|nr:hypothetical protein EV424DRAFT_1349296 [Suillus variegatus]